MKNYRIPGYIAFFILQGCASATLTVNVDLYDEDPRLVAPMTPEDVERILTDLRTLQAEAEKERSLSIQTAERAYAIYSSAWKRAGGRHADLSSLNRQKNTYVKAVREPKGSFTKSLDDVYEDLEDYVAVYLVEYQNEAGVQKDNANDTDLGTQNSAGSNKPNTCKHPDGCDVEPGPMQKLADWLSGRDRKTTPKLGDDDVVRGLSRNLVLKKKETVIVQKLTKVIGAYWDQKTIDEQLFINWANLEHLLKTNYLLARRHGRMEEMQLLEEVAIETKGQAQQLADEIAQQTGMQPAAVRLPLPGRPASLFESAAAVGIELESLRNGLSNNAASRMALSSLVQNTSRFFELIDRLQDPGDAVWRIVSDPANERHWNTEFSETYFMAEGQSEVVIVRDSPMRFRIQRGANDPAALIEGQLLIARAVSNAALSIAGAATGLPTQALASAEGSTNVGDTDPPEEAFQERRAKAEAEARGREKTLNGLSTFLSNVSSNLDSLDSEEATEIQKRRLISYLKGFKASLEGVNVSN